MGRGWAGNGETGERRRHGSKVDYDLFDQRKGWQGPCEMGLMQKRVLAGYCGR